MFDFIFGGRRKLEKERGQVLYFAKHKVYSAPQSNCGLHLTLLRGPGEAGR